MQMQVSERRQTKGSNWRKMRRANVLKPASEELIAETMREYDLTREEALALLDAETKKVEFWVNDIYQVEVRQHGRVWQLNVRRRDGRVILRDWRHFQQIKNDIVGPECEAMELYPAESRKVDTSNKYHLWAVADPAYRFPIGFQDRDVRYDDSKTPGMRQRPDMLGEYAVNCTDEERHR